eukprot:1985024-Rhodomonas_salina.1
MNLLRDPRRTIYTDALHMFKVRSDYAFDLTLASVDFVCLFCVTLQAFEHRMLTKIKAVADVCFGDFSQVFVCNPHKEKEVIKILSKNQSKASRCPYLSTRLPGTGVA